MTEQTFQQGMSRLSSTFGKQAYSVERTSLIWREMNTLPDGAWIKIVDELIGTHRQAPLLPEIRELAAIARERFWSKEKKQHANDAKAFFKSSFAGEDLQTLCQMVIARMKGQVGDQTWNAQIKAFEGVTTHQIQTCRACFGDGLIFQRDDEGYEWTHRCFCFEGQKQPARYPVWRRA